MASFSLDDIRTAAEAKYGSTDIDLGDGRVVVLQNPLRLGKKDRDALTGLQDKLEAPDADQVDVLGDAILLVAKDKAVAKDLLAAIGDDLAVLAEIFEQYTKGSQVGEASASQD